MAEIVNMPKLGVDHPGYLCQFRKSTANDPGMLWLIVPRPCSYLKEVCPARITSPIQADIIAVFLFTWVKDAINSKTAVVQRPLIGSDWKLIKG